MNYAYATHDSFMAWFNYTTNDYDYRTNAPQTDTEALIYMPQDRNVKGLYLCHRQLSESVLSAMTKTLEAVVGMQ